MFQGDMDPEIANLLGSTASSKSSSGSNQPDYNILFDDPSNIEEAEPAPEVDLKKSSFPQITKQYESTPHDIFNHPDYYKVCLSNEGDQAQRIHGLLQKYINAKDPKDRGVFRQQMIPAFWEFLSGVAKKTPGKLPDPKRLLLRFGMLHPTMVGPEERNQLARVVEGNPHAQPIYYLDEWFKSVGTGAVKPSQTDEVRVAKSNEQQHIKQLLEKAIGKRDGAKNLLKSKNDERANYETSLVNLTKGLCEHATVPGFPEIGSAYTESQRRAFSEIQLVMKNMFNTDKDLTRLMEEFLSAVADVETLEGKASDVGATVSVDVAAIETEFDTVRQMTKLTIGRQGNHFPILTREYFHCGPNEIGIRENVISQLTMIESIDPEAFCRSYKNQMNRIVPFVILLPNYGDTGVCWEPFDRFNRATSRGRIAVPMYPKNLTIALLSAVADLRWQVAKEKASYYWMEEGLTGNYYQAFTAKKLKGDVKEYFIQDYILWVTKESDGVQKLDKETRAIFWRYVPFSQPVKEKLKSRSYIYQELYQRDVNRTLSDGY